MEEKESLIDPIRTDSYLKNGTKRSTKCDIYEKQHQIRCNQNSWKYNTIYLIRSDSYLLNLQKYCKPVGFHLEKPKFKRKSETYLFSVDHQVSKWNANRKITLSTFYLKVDR